MNRKILCLVFAVGVISLVLMHANVGFCDDASTKRFRDDFLPLIIKKYHRGNYSTFPQQHTLKAFTTGYKDGQKTYTQEITAATSYFSSDLFINDSEMTINGKKTYSIKMYNAKYIANLNKNGSDYLLTSVVSRSADNVQTPVNGVLDRMRLYRSPTGSSQTLAEMLTDSKMEWEATEANDRTWVIHLINSDFKAESEEAVGFKTQTVILDPNNDWRIREILTDLGTFRIKEDYEYSGPYSLFDGHVTKKTITNFDKNENIRSKSTLELIGSSRTMTPLTSAACYLPYYGIREPPEFAAKPWSRFLWLFAFLIIFMIGVYILWKSKRRVGY